jgi:hypothetical protein
VSVPPSLTSSSSGHSMYDPKITHELVKATDEFYTVIDGAVTF